MQQQTSGKITGFEQLIAWQKSQDLAVSVYTLTKSFPNEEKFAMISQIRRAATSVSANIAEGFGRKTAKDKVQFYTIAYGSLLEVKNFLYLAEKLGYLNSTQLRVTFDLLTDNQKLMNALIRSVRNNES